MASSLSLGVPPKRFAKELYGEIQKDNVSNGAAALAYYLLLAIFPAMIFLLSLLPYLPIPNLHAAIMEMVSQALPGEAARTFEGVVAEVTQRQRGGLLSFGILLTIWAASNGLYAVMQHLNITYDVKESRPFWKARGIAICLTVLFAVLVIGAFALIIFGGILQEWLMQNFGFPGPILWAFAILRWAIIFLLLLTGFAITYYFGPDVEQKFKFITPGALFGVIVLALASLLFRFYVSNFGNYSATYGSIGAVIILMFWLYIAGLVVLLGSEINALAEHYADTGKNKGEKREPPANLLGHKPWISDPSLSVEAAVGRAQTAQMRTQIRTQNRSWMMRNLDLLIGITVMIFALRQKRSKKSPAT